MQSQDSWSGHKNDSRGNSRASAKPLSHNKSCCFQLDYIDMEPNHTLSIANIVENRYTWTEPRDVERAFPRGGGTPYVMGDTYVPRFWPPFFTLAGSSTIFLGYFFSSTNTKTIFWGIKTTNSYRIRSFRPQISFFPRSFWVQFSAASGTPPSFFGPSTPPGGVSQSAN